MSLTNKTTRETLFEEVTAILEDVEERLKNTEFRDREGLAKFRNEALSNLKAYFRYIPSLPEGQRKDFGIFLNQTIAKVEKVFLDYERSFSKKRFEELDKKRAVDVTAVWHNGQIDQYKVPFGFGAAHPLWEEIQFMIEIFRDFGFDIYWGKELDNEVFVFDALNIPKDHPAREGWDTFYTKEGFVPTTHTSNMQVRVLADQFKAYSNHARAIVVGRTFRNEELDARHSHTFYQLEGVVVHEKASLAELLSLLVKFLEVYFAQEIRYKVVPAHFPFVEPGLEFSIQCVFCGGNGCSVCGKGWLEILGAGMIHPKVLESAGIDPDRYSGYAWGLGIDRLVMLKHNIDDIRTLYQNNLFMLKPVKSDVK